MYHLQALLVGLTFNFVRRDCHKLPNLLDVLWMSRPFAVHEFFHLDSKLVVNRIASFEFFYIVRILMNGHLLVASFGTD
jgi:hypothetical protein